MREKGTWKLMSLIVQFQCQTYLLQLFKTSTDLQRVVTFIFFSFDLGDLQRRAQNGH